MAGKSSVNVYQLQFVYRAMLQNDYLNNVSASSWTVIFVETADAVQICFLVLSARHLPTCWHFARRIWHEHSRGPLNKRTHRGSLDWLFGNLRLLWILAKNPSKNRCQLTHKLIFAVRELAISWILASNWWLFRKSKITFFRPWVSISKAFAAEA